MDELLLEHAMNKQEKKAPAAGGGSNGYEPDYESSTHLILMRITKNTSLAMMST